MKTLALLTALTLLGTPHMARATDAPPGPKLEEIEYAIDYLWARRRDFAPPPARGGPAKVGFAIFVAGVTCILFPVVSQGFLSSPLGRWIPLTLDMEEFIGASTFLGPLFGMPLTFMGGSVLAVGALFAAQTTPRDQFNAGVRKFLDLPREEQLRKLEANPQLAARFVAMAASIERVEAAANAAHRGHMDVAPTR